MAVGLLRVKGTIDLNQFWPSGSADADTTKILVDVGPGAFQFRPAPGAAFRNTNAFANATVIGFGRKSPIDNKGRITIRLQGIDAPELHYRPTSHLKDSQGRTKRQKERFLEVNEEYRQYLAETATVRLRNSLQPAADNQDRISCVVETMVDQPNEVFDIYGRFVGDIIIRINNQQRNVNTWLVRQGLAYPAFYNSMSCDEIETLTVAANQAWAEDLLVWVNLADYVGRLDWGLRYRRPSENPVYNAANDVGRVVLPKLFRRLTTWEANKYAGMVPSGFWSYLESRNDTCYLTQEFLAEPTAAALYGLHDFVDQDGFIRIWPEDLIFREAPSRLIGPGGGEVNW